MKTLISILCCVLTFDATAKDVYIPPTLLTPAEMHQAEIAMEKTRIAVNQHWQARSLIAKSKHNNEISAIKAPVKNLNDSIHKSE